MGNHPEPDWIRKDPMTTQTGRILVVDDDPFVVEMLAALLEEEGHTVDKAENGREALAKYSGSGGTALVISDMNMPEMDGVALAREIRKYRKDLPLILLSSVGQKGVPGLFDTVLNKPINLDQLRTAVAKLASEVGASLTA